MYIEEEKDELDPEEWTSASPRRQTSKTDQKSQNGPMESRTDQCKEIFITFYS